MTEAELGTHEAYSVSGTEIKIDTEEHLKCEHCGSVWVSESDTEPPICPHCGTETDRKVAYRGIVMNPKF